LTRSACMRICWERMAFDKAADETEVMDYPTALSKAVSISSTVFIIRADA